MVDFNVLQNDKQIIIVDNLLMKKQVIMYNDLLMSIVKDYADKSAIDMQIDEIEQTQIDKDILKKNPSIPTFMNGQIDLVERAIHNSPRLKHRNRDNYKEKIAPYILDMAAKDLYRNSQAYESAVHNDISNQLDNKHEVYLMSICKIAILKKFKRKDQPQVEGGSRSIVTRLTELKNELEKENPIYIHDKENGWQLNNVIDSPNTVKFKKSLNDISDDDIRNLENFEKIAAINVACKQDNIFHCKHNDKYIRGNCVDKYDNDVVNTNRWNNHISKIKKNTTFFGKPVYSEDNRQTFLKKYATDKQKAVDDCLSKECEEDSKLKNVECPKLSNAFISNRDKLYKELQKFIKKYSNQTGGYKYKYLKYKNKYLRLLKQHNLNQ